MERKSYSKQSSARLLNLIASGTLNEKVAHTIATILEKRFPTPLNTICKAKEAA